MKFKKIWLIMKLTTILLTAAVLHAAAKTTAQTITYTAKGVTLQQFFSVVEKQAGYTFFYDKQDVASIQPLDVDLQNVPVTIAMDRVLSDQPLDFDIQGNTIFVSRKNAPKRTLVEIPTLSAKAPPVKGRVVNEKGEPVSGATIKIKGSNVITTTNTNGEFSIEAESNAMLVITATNIESQEIKLNGRSELTVAAKTKVSDLDETVVIAYGKTSKRFLTGNVASVTAKQIEKQPVTNPLLALQGQVPGLIINQTTGFANSGVTVQIQGPNSLLNNNTPFYVIDGVPYPSQALPGFNKNMLGFSGNGTARGGTPGGSGFGEQRGSALSFINPQDIESISILKDADATAIYGSQAANGAILITTKKGKAGAGKVSLNLQHGMQQDKRFMKVMNRKEYLEMRRDAYFLADGLTENSPQFANQYDLNGAWDTTRSTDWQKLLLGGVAQYTNFQGTVSGGTPLAQYLISLNYNRQTTIFPTDLSDQKGSVHVNLNHSSTNGRFKMGFNLQYMLDNNRLPVTGDLTTKAYLLPPVAPALYKEDGTLNWQVDSNGVSTFFNPLAGLKDKAINKTTNLVANYTLSYQLWKNLVLSSLIGYNSTQQDEMLNSTFGSMSPETFASGSKPFTIFSNARQNSWNIDPQLAYTATIGNGKLESYIGATYRMSDQHYQEITASQYVTDQLLENLMSAGNISVNTSSISQYRYGALFGHVGYNWGNKYLINGNARRDGSSRFGYNNMFHTFWSLAAGWIFSEESFVKKNLPWLTFGKLNTSYGSSGSDGIGNYLFLANYTSSGASRAYQGINPVTPGGLPNPNLEWEETHKFSTTLSLGFIQDRILLTATYYRNLCSNQLMGKSLPSSVGYTGVASNLPATVENLGWEWTLNTKPITSKELVWASNLNISMNRNKLLRFPNIESSPYANGNFVVGKPMDYIRLWHYAGVNPETGLYQFYKADGSVGAPSYPDDYYIRKSFMPKFTGGWNNSLSFKGITLDLLLYFMKGNLNTNSSIGFVGNGGMYNLPAGIKYWRNKGDLTSIQKLSAVNNFDVWDSYYNVSQSDFTYVDASFIRLKNISLSYEFPSKWLGKVGIKRLNILSSVQNLLTFTNYKGLDPESGNDGLPPLRVITFGLQVDF